MEGMSRRSCPAEHQRLVAWIWETEAEKEELEGKRKKRNAQEPREESFQKSEWLVVGHGQECQGWAL